MLLFLFQNSISTPVTGVAAPIFGFNQVELDDGDDADDDDEADDEADVDDDDEDGCRHKKLFISTSQLTRGEGSFAQN